MWVLLGLLFVTVIFLAYLIKLYLSRNDNFWKSRGVYSFKKNIGAFELISGKKFVFDLDMEHYEELGDQKCGGGLEFGSPALLVKDLDLAKNILVKDFDHFVDRRPFGNDPILGESLFFITGQKWKDMRGYLSPTFTSGKIRRMFDQFEKSGNKLKKYVEMRFSKTGSGGYVVTMPEITRRFSVDVIGGAVFGLETDALTNSESKFYKIADQAGNIGIGRLLRSFTLIFLPKIAAMLNIYMMDSEVNEFFRGLLIQALRERKSSTEKRGDFLQMLVEAGEADSKIDESELDQFEKDAQLKEFSDSKKKLQLTETMAVAQGFLFFIAGFDTVGNALNIATYVLAAHQEIQERVFKEVEETIESCGGKITYEGINRMEYLDMFFSEVLRLYIPLQRVERKCSKDYTIPGTKSVIPKGTLVGIAAEAIHHDPKYYPDPMTFDPERFTPENKANRNPYSFLPFGIGPRNCIGMRFALIESKVAIANLVLNFKIEPTPKTPIPVQIIRQGGGSKTEADLELQLIPRS